MVIEKSVSAMVSYVVIQSNVVLSGRTYDKLSPDEDILSPVARKFKVELFLSNWPAKIQGLPRCYNFKYIQAANSRGADQNADASDDFGILQIF